jgi:hypothetical protein
MDQQVDAPLRGAHPSNMPAEVTERRTGMERTVDHGTDFDQAAAPMRTEAHHTAAVPIAHEHEHREHHLGNERVINTQSVPIEIEKVYEQPMKVETKQFVPAVVEKTMRQDAVVKKVETIQSELKRESVLHLDQGKARVEQETVNTTQPREVSSELIGADRLGKTSGMSAAPMGKPVEVTRQIETTGFSKVGEVVHAEAAGLAGKALSDLKTHDTYVHDNIDRMAMNMHGHNVATIKSESIPITVERTYEKPITIETKQEIPMVVEKRLQHEAIVRKTETLPAHIEKREWVEVPQGPRAEQVVNVESEVIPQGVKQSVGTAVTRIGQAITGDQSQRVEKGEWHSVGQSIHNLADGHHAASHAHTHDATNTREIAPGSTRTL